MSSVCLGVFHTFFEIKLPLTSKNEEKKQRVNTHQKQNAIVRTSNERLTGCCQATVSRMRSQLQLFNFNMSDGADLRSPWSESTKGSAWKSDSTGCLGGIEMIDSWRLEYSQKTNGADSIHVFSINSCWFMIHSSFLDAFCQKSSILKWSSNMQFSSAGFLYGSLRLLPFIGVWHLMNLMWYRGSHAEKGKHSA